MLQFEVDLEVLVQRNNELFQPGVADEGFLAL